MQLQDVVLSMGEPIEPDVITSTSNPKSLGWWLLVANACCALCFYSISAGQTVGHRGDLGRMWIAGRIVAEGKGASLYDPVQQETALRPYLDDDNIAGLHMKGIGWLTYPPIQGVLYAPLGATSPAAAQWWMVQISLCAVVVAAIGLSRIHSHGVSASVAILTLLLQPAFFSNVASGQNATVTLAIIVVGWGLLLRDRAILAGAVWGLLAYKPTWALAVCWIPMATRHPKAYFGMFASGMFLVITSMALCGFQAWIDWFEIARKVEAGYASNPDWVWARRDLTGLIEHLWGVVSPVVSWAFSAILVLITALILNKRSSDISGRIEGSLLFCGVALSCSKFMYYDILMATPAFLLAWSEWKQLTRSSAVVLTLLSSLFFGAFLFAYNTWPLCLPLETAATLGLWLWSIWLLKNRQALRILLFRQDQPGL